MVPPPVYQTLAADRRVVIGRKGRSIRANPSNTGANDPRVQDSAMVPTQNEFVVNVIEA
jgi:hypothetical protein